MCWRSTILGIFSVTEMYLRLFIVPSISHTGWGSKFSSRCMEFLNEKRTTFLKLRLLVLCQDSGWSLDWDLFFRWIGERWSRKSDPFVPLIVNYVWTYLQYFDCSWWSKPRCLTLTSLASKIVTVGVMTWALYFYGSFMTLSFCYGSRLFGNF